MLGTQTIRIPNSCRGKTAVIQVDDQVYVLGRAPTVLGVIGSVRLTVKSLLDRVKPKMISSSSIA